MGFENICTVPGKSNLARVVPRIYRWVYDSPPLVIENSVVVMTAGSQSRRSQME